MLDNIREWISDNLRYILLGLAVIVLIVIIVVVVRVASHSGSSNSGTTVEVETEARTEDESEDLAGVADSLEKDQPDVLALATSYWDAVVDQDYDTLEDLCDQSFDDSERAEMESLYGVVESVSDITTYSKSGLTEDSYVAYVYMEWNLVGIETAAPTLREMYMETDDQGSLVVVPSDDYTESIEQYTSERQTDSDVQALIRDVNNTLSERCDEDEDLRNYVDSTAGSSSDEEEEEVVEGETDDENLAGESLGTMYVYVEGGLNVRDSASADGTLLGSLPEGSEVEVLENQDDGWSRISYIDTSGSTVEGYVMSEYLSE